MGIKERLKNTIKYGGPKEVIRKGFFSVIYNRQGKRTKREVVGADMEYGLNKEPREHHIVVSLTSFPARFFKIGMCLKSLILQTVKPDRIIVYLGNDCTESDITEEMKSYEAYGVEFRIDGEKNLKPHKKYYYAMREFPDSIVVTADDDVFYPREWMQKLYDSYLRHPKAVNAWRVHYIQMKNGRIQPYNYWIDQIRSVRKPSKRLIAIGNGGILYPPGIFDDDLFETDAIESLCLGADDLWLKCHEIRKNVPVVWVKSMKVDPVPIPSEKSLSSENVFTGKNDKILREIMDYLKLDDSDFLDRE